MVVGLSLKALSLMEVFSGIFTVIKEQQLRNAELPISSTVEGM